MTMTASFVVYIDESGDEGFFFDKGSSQWFVLSAVITRKASDRKTVKLVDHIRSTVFNRSDKEPLHFRRLKHEHRAPFIDTIAKADLKVVTVAIHKPSILEREKFMEKYRLYFYAVRLLLERASWYCRDHKTPSIGGDGSARISFSNRGGMSYTELRRYLKVLQQRTEIDAVQIDWNVIKPQQIAAYSSSKRLGLQIADAVASGFFYGVNVNTYGFVEDRYARMLKPVVYAHKGIYKGYGLKLWPREANYYIENTNHYNWLREDYQF